MHDNISFLIQLSPFLEFNNYLIFLCSQFYPQNSSIKLYKTLLKTNTIGLWAQFFSWPHPSCPPTLYLHLFSFFISVVKSSHKSLWVCVCVCERERKRESFNTIVHKIKCIRWFISTLNFFPPRVLYPAPGWLLLDCYAGTFLSVILNVFSLMLNPLYFKF